MQEVLRVNNKIDLEAFVSNQRRETHSPVFKIIQMKVSFFKQRPITLSFGDPQDDKSQFFTLFIGRNGMGKSSLLRAVIDFIVEVRNPKSRFSRRTSPVFISLLEYVLDNHIYKIEIYGKNIKYQKDRRTVNKETVEFPLIIASTMGMFDKFPINSIPGRERSGNYDSAYYKYVGPKASNNMFTSKTNVLLHILSSLNDIEDEAQLKKIGAILKYIGYDAKILFRFKLKDTIDEQLRKKRDVLNSDSLLFLESLKSKNNLFRQIQPDTDGISKVRGLNIKELDRLRQEGLLTSFRCTLYKKGDEVDCNQLSSGEFNMLSIVLSVIFSAGHQHLLVLLDEPEISQHPNWQVGIIDKLNEALSDYGCHFLIATHCHYLVSNLPMRRSNLMIIDKREGEILVEPMPSETYGWSSEEVLLKVFQMSTDRSKYLADLVGQLMTKIGNNDIVLSDVRQELNFLEKVSVGLNNIDPMKKIIDTIIKEFSKNEQV